MKKTVCWMERLADDVRREVRVSFSQKGMKWQYKRSDEARWDYDHVPTVEDWVALEDRMMNRYQRRAVPYKDLERVRQMRVQAEKGH